MFRFSIIFIFLLPVSAFYGQSENRDPVLIKGRVVDMTYNPVPYLNIFIKSRLTGTIADYEGKYQIVAYPGDTMTFSGVGYRSTSFIIPHDIRVNAYTLDVLMEKDTVGLKEVVIYPWPSTFKQFKEDFMELEVEDPLAGLDLHLPSPEEMKMLSCKIGEPGQITLYSGPGPISLFYNKFSKEAKQRENYALAMRKENVYNRYNREVISKVTGLKKEDDIAAFMKFCPLNDKFILQSSDYDLFLAIRNCYAEFAQLIMPADTIYTDTIR